MKTKEEIESYLHSHIPITKAMGVTVQKSEYHQLILDAPLTPNINHRDTVFGGSAASIAILSAWALIHARLLDSNLSHRLVIQKSRIVYLKPIIGDFTARCVIDNEVEWERFLRLIKRRGKARLPMRAELTCNGEIVGEFEGDYVAIQIDSPFP